ncbi:unnamed protein product [Mytilus edulis]|uniref:Ig-like domain-containing protein n=1 Tax=Mytilus edulis TaxID=6550 RepID=A0A8S3UL56_MYTED|nr:unnamed protein product [Mytilus edulis]
MKIHSIHVCIGDKVSIGCDISYCPRDFEVFWEKIELENDQMRDLIEINDQTMEKYEMFNLKSPHLTIKNAQMSDEAYYCCGIKYTSSSGDLIIIRSEKARLHVNEAENIGTLNTGVGELNMTTYKSKELTDSNQRSITSGTPDSNTDDKMSDTSSNATGSRSTSSDSSRGTDPKNGQTSGNIDINLKEKSQLKVVPPKEDFSLSEMERIADIHKFEVKNVHADGNLEKNIYTDSCANIEVYANIIDVCKCANTQL